MLSAFPVFTRSLNSFVRANKSKIQLHFVALHFSSIIVFRPLLIWWLLLQTAVGVCSTAFCTCLRNANADFYYFPNVARSQSFTSLRKLRSVLILRLLFDCHNTNHRSSQKFHKDSIFAVVLRGVNLTNHLFLKDKKIKQIKSKLLTPSRSFFSPFLFVISSI